MKNYSPNGHIYKPFTLILFVKATDSSRTNEAKFENSWTTCGIIMHFGKLGPWEVPHLAPHTRCGTSQGPSLPKFVKTSQVVQLLSNFISTVPVLSMAFTCYTYDSNIGVRSKRAPLKNTFFREGTSGIMSRLGAKVLPYTSHDPLLSCLAKIL